MMIREKNLSFPVIKISLVIARFKKARNREGNLLSIVAPVLEIEVKNLNGPYRNFQLIPLKARAVSTILISPYL